MIIISTITNVANDDVTIKNAIAATLMLPQKITIDATSCNRKPIKPTTVCYWECCCYITAVNK